MQRKGGIVLENQEKLNGEEDVRGSVGEMRL